MILGIYGASGLGTEYLEVAIGVNEIEHRWEELIFIDDDAQKNGQLLVEKEIISYKESIERYTKNGIEFILSIGEPLVKEIVFEKVQNDGCNIINLFHPGTSIGIGSQLGKGIVIKDQSGIPPMTKVGNNVLIQGKTALGHGLDIGDNAVISSFVFIGGDTVIGKNAYIAPHACLRNGIHIGENAIIGMGSVVTKDIPDNAVAYGNPCEVKRINEKGRVFSK